MISYLLSGMVIGACCVGYCWWFFSRSPKPDYYMGVDVGRGESRTKIAVIDRQACRIVDTFDVPADSVETWGEVFAKRYSRHDSQSEQWGMRI